MTAKELKHTAQTIIKHKGVYQFTPLEMDMFCTQLCKEQREICAEAFEDREYRTPSETHIMNIIANAPIPEV